jgi:hypothetical protein
MNLHQDQWYTVQPQLMLSLGSSGLNTKIISGGNLTLIFLTWYISNWTLNDGKS